MGETSFRNILWEDVADEAEKLLAKMPRKKVTIWSKNA
jgi:hypothetical protein